MNSNDKYLENIPTNLVYHSFNKDHNKQETNCCAKANVLLYI
jgi:hypothetical protein